MDYRSSASEMTPEQRSRLAKWRICRLRIVTTALSVLSICALVLAIVGYHREIGIYFGGNETSGSCILLFNQELVISYSRVEPIQGFHPTFENGIDGSMLGEISKIGELAGCLAWVTTGEVAIIISMPHLFIVLAGIVVLGYVRRQRAKRMTD